MAAFASSNTVIGSKYNMSSKYQMFLVSCFYFLLFFIRKVVAEQHFYNVTRLGAGRGGLGGKRQLGSCNLFQGKWVFDASYKFYDPRSCPFIDPEFNCLGHGRPDKQYLKYSWQPDSCKIPRFNGLDFLERWRGKKIMFVGDSLSLNMWQSLACMIHASVPSSKYSFVSRDSMHSVTFQYYGVSIMVYRTPYLVDIVREKGGNVLNLNSIEAGNVWKGMDMLIFNSWHWWTHTGKKSQGWDYIRDGSQLYQGMNHLVAFYKGMTTWARWVNMNVDPSKTKVFFQGISPTHYEGREWNQPRKNCYGEAEPLSGSTYPAGEPPAAAILNKVLSTVKKPVYLLDITTLSQLRKDAHPSTYGDGSGTDCSHWCLPGLPDTWNQLLYAALVM